MYLKHYHFESAPFENSPDPRFFYASDDHMEALAAIEYTVRMRKGIVLVTGEIGAGKTTVSHTLLTRISDSSDVCHIHQGADTRIQLIKQICQTLGLDFKDNPDRCDYLDALKEELLIKHAEGRSVVVIVDEAQALPIEVLDEIRLLSNIETTSVKLLQFVLIGQPELRELLHNPMLQSLCQRIVMAHHLTIMSPLDMRSYIAHRLTVAAGKQSAKISITSEAMAAVYQHTHGVPRLVNTLLDSALLMGYASGIYIIDHHLVNSVARNAFSHFYSNHQTELSESKQNAFVLNQAA